MSARLLRAFRIWLAATEVEVFSKAFSAFISFARSARLGSAIPGVEGSELLADIVGGKTETERDKGEGPGDLYGFR